MKNIMKGVIKYTCQIRMFFCHFRRSCSSL